MTRARPPRLAGLLALPGLILPWALGLAASGTHAQERPAPARLVGTVERVVDGDTLRLHGLGPALRVWGLDAPERDTRAGPAATQAMAGLVAGQPLSCGIRDIDRYGRIVGQCHLPDGRDIAAALIAAGVAREYCRFSRGHYGTCAPR